MSKLCIYHNHCSDGIFAAWSVREAFPDEEIEFFPAPYGQSAPDVKGKDVIIVDFSYDRETTIKLSMTAASFTIIDHHKTTKENLRGIETSLKCLSKIIFDMHKSGCELAWEYYHPGITPPRVLMNVGDRDLWKFELDHTNEIASFIEFLGRTFETCDFAVKDENYEEMVNLGSILKQQTSNYIDALIDTVAEMQDIDGHTVPVANAPAFFGSEMGNKLCIKYDADFSASYYRTSGGRHRNASGFEVDELPWEEKDKNTCQSKEESTSVVRIPKV